MVCVTGVSVDKIFSKTTLDDDPGIIDCDIDKKKKKKTEISIFQEILKVL